MFRFFRKIRYQLIENGKTSQYLKYAIGEIALVVIGILIALQINNWNENRKDQKALNEYLVKIRAHTLEDLSELKKITAGRTQIANTCKLARESMLNKTEAENLMLFMFAGAAFADFYFKPNSGGFEALKNSRYFGKINNTPLDSLLSKYQGLIELIAENETSFNKEMVEQEAYLSTKFDRSLILAAATMPPDSLKITATSQAEIDQAFVEFTSSIPYRNIISLAAFQFDAMIAQYNQLSTLGNEVVAEIDNITEK